MITLVLGCMFSSKTSTLLTHERKFSILKYKTCYIKHSIDTRYTTDDKIINHDGITCLNSDVLVTDVLMKLKDKIQYYDCVLIDEGQFFSDLKEFCEMFGNDKKIIIAGLSNDYKREPFQPIIDILSICDKILHLTALCSKCGDDAPFTARIVESNNQTLVGSIESYEPRCRKCHTIP